MGTIARTLPSLFGVFFLTACHATAVTAPSASFAEFEAHLEELRAGSHIPSISVAIANNQTIVWSRGYGLADIDAQRSAADTTVYHLASLTKPFASVVVLQLVQEGLISLDDPVSKYGINLQSTGTIRVRHLLSHTSEGTPGSHYSYNGDRFSLLDSVIVRTTGKSLAQALDTRVIARIGLRRTAPNPQSASFQASGLSRAPYEANMARGYTWAGGKQTLTQYPASFSSAAGLTSSVEDYANFSLAMDRDALLTPSSKALAFSPTVLAGGDVSPYGLGWFATDYKGVRIVWHYGYWTANSSLIIKVPERGLTFVILANSDALSSPYPLGSGKLDASPWAREFLETFVIGKVPLPGS